MARSVEQLYLALERIQEEVVVHQRTAHARAEDRAIGTQEHAAALKERNTLGRAATNVAAARRELARLYRQQEARS